MHPRQQRIVDVYGKHPETLDEIAESAIAVINKKDPVVGFAWNIYYKPKVSNSHSAPLNGEMNWGGDKGKPRGYPGMYGRVWIRYAEPNKDSFDSSGNFRDTLTHTGTGGGGAYEGPFSQISSASYKTKVPRAKNGSAARGFDYEYPRVCCYSWDYRLFLSDWPGIADTIYAEIVAYEEAEDKALAWAKLNGKYYVREKYKLTHKFEWHDPATKAADEAFLKMLKERTAGGVDEFTKKKGLVYPAWS